MNKNIFIISNEIDFERSFAVMRELRPHLSFSDFKKIYTKAHQADSYQIVAIEEQGQILALMGYRFLSDFVRGKHIYIDDLVTTQNARSQGLGAELLNYAEGIARQNGCRVLRLCAVLENEKAIQFYERNKWKKRAYALTKKLD